MNYMNEEIESVSKRTRNLEVVCKHCGNMGFFEQLCEYVNQIDNESDLRVYNDGIAHGIDKKDLYYPGGEWSADFVKVFRCKNCKKISVFMFSVNQEKYNYLDQEIERGYEEGYNYDLNNYLMGDNEQIFPQSVNIDVIRNGMEKKEFIDNVVINSVSQKFVEIYNEVVIGEKLGMNNTYGMGYRKALEFLIKDYAVMNNPSDEEDIKKAFLGDCIKKYIDNDTIKGIAKRAAWLGNDETHYVRKWGDKDISDLKRLIELTMNAIESEVEEKKLRTTMPPR